MNKEIYLDCASSAPVTDSVISLMTSIYQKKLGNSSSIHQSGVQSNIHLEKARIKISEKINCLPEEVYFTSGATESNNLAILGLVAQNKLSEKNEIIISSIEHSTINEITDYLKLNGLIIKIVSVDTNGFIKIDELKKLISEKTLLVSIIHANNEIGVIQNLIEIGELCKKNKIYFHSDGAQAFCKTKINVREMDLDLYTLSGHKIHAPKGIGALYIKKNLKIEPLLLGGPHENNMRPGTVPVELAYTFAHASDLYTSDSLDYLEKIYTQVISELKKKFHNFKLNGCETSRLPNIINFQLSGFSGKKILQKLDKSGVRISTGSACNQGKKQASHVLMALSLSEKQALESIRVSWGLNTKISEIDEFLKLLYEISNESENE